MEDDYGILAAGGVVGGHFGSIEAFESLSVIAEPAACVPAASTAAAAEEIAEFALSAAVAVVVVVVGFLGLNWQTTVRSHQS